MVELVKKFDEFLEEREIPDKQGEILVMLGPPGSGKGTLSKELEKNYGFQHISTGDVIRKSDDEELKPLIDQGKLIPDDIMVRILRKEMKKLDLEKGIIFDGFPRTIKQARRLDRMLGKMGVGLNHVVLLELSEETAKDRIKRRAETQGRKDDTSEEVINKRFDEYKDKTLPLIEFYDKSRKLIRVTADEGKKSVLKKVVKRLDLKKDQKDQISI